MATAVFPDDFQKKPHPISPALGRAAWQWALYDQAGEMKVSVVGGCEPILHGNGIDTFEMWDFADPEPLNWLSAEEINKHLQERNIEAPT